LGAILEKKTAGRVDGTIYGEWIFMGGEGLPWGLNLVSQDLVVKFLFCMTLLKKWIDCPFTESLVEGW
jgi:hypothetical protein